VNPVVGVVGVFNLQGSSWDRIRRKFHIHDSRGARLDTWVTPHDIEVFRQDAAAATIQQQQKSNGQLASSRWDAVAAAAAVDGSNNGSAAAILSNGQADSTTAAAAANSSNDAQQRFAVYRYGTEELLVCEGPEGVNVSLDPAGSDLVWISPLHCHNGASLAPLGLIEMFNGGGSVLSCSITPGNTHNALGRAAASTYGRVKGDDGLKAVATMQLRGCGRFLAYSSSRPARVLVNLTPRDFVWDQFTKRLEFEVPQLSEEDLHCEVEVLY
jgi:raffinose synthase